MTGAVQTCAQCGGAIENAAYSGIYCGECYGENIAPRPGWRAWLPAPAALGAAAVGLTRVAHVNVEGIEYVSLVGGGVGLAAGLLGAVVARQSPADWRSRQIGLSLLVAAIGAVVVATSGVLR